MYVSKLFLPENIDEVTDFLEQNTFASLVSLVNGQLWATHIPMILGENESGEKVLWAHISKANEQWKEIAEQEEVMAIFQGAHTFITADWYDHENVSTWNYMVAHVYGKVRLLEGEDLKKAVSVLVEKYEPAHSKGRLENLSEKYLQQQMRGIYGIELKISKIEASFKLSQNRDDANYQNIIKELEKRGDADSLKIASQMKIIRKI